MGLATVHRIDHQIVYIHEADTAWDHERIKYELAVIEGKRPAEQGRPVLWTKRTEHPWWRYVAGFTRGDLKGVEDYLKHRDGTEGPVRFHFERIGSMPAWSVVKGLNEKGQFYDRDMTALRLSLKAVDGFDLEGGRKGQPLTDSDLQKLRETYGESVIEALGAVAYKMSQELTDAEKKS